MNTTKSTLRKPVTPSQSTSTVKNWDPRETRIQFLNRRSRLLLLPAGQSVIDRVSWGKMSLTVLSGSCEIEYEDDCVHLFEHQSHQIPANKIHSIRAEHDLRAVLSFEPNC